MLGLVVFVGSFLGVTLYHQERILAELVGRMSGAQRHVTFEQT